MKLHSCVVDNEHLEPLKIFRLVLMKFYIQQLSGDIHEEMDTPNRMLDRMGNDMDSSRGVLSGTMDKFKMLFETKSSRRIFTLVALFVVLFLVVYYLTIVRILRKDVFDATNTNGILVPTQLNVLFQASNDKDRSQIIVVDAANGFQLHIINT
ncbi:bet1-like SNARE 1-1 [Solanum dulcamara]|uniref:bet1-like SNARE 1-1 n=1 Tax=Solanum dulcamara TaxID=45834 RepID=UPI002486475B|nr:bet1-like SNARE 1-1 [Solanum dulcamara]